MSADTILALGLNHTIAPVAIREKLAFSKDCSRPLLALRALDGCDECLLLSTCNRVEVYFVSKSGAAAADAARKLLFAGTDLTDEEARRYTYFHQGADAVRHLFRVAASLDSMVVGEPQILGQLKEAFRLAGEHKAAGFLLDRLFTKAFFVAKRVRTETNIGGSAVSISYAAVQLAKKILGDLAGRKVLLVGAGEMAELAAEHLVGQGIAEVVVANRTYERAVTLANRFHGRAVPLDDLHAQLEAVDILISSTGAPGFILTRDEVKPVMRQRLHRPLFLIDIAVPRDLDPTINDVDNVYLYDIDDLMQVVETGKADRDQAAAAAELIVAHEAAKFGEWLNGLAVVPTIAALKKRSAALCQAELAKTMAHLGGLSDQDKKAVEILAQSIANKMLHHPMLFLKHEANGMDTQARLSFIRACYDLDETGGEEPERN
ncbi:MAG: glutamyl-tRNA reductase [Desulfobacterales bacterium CG2_30_60_27]|nr:MAG: glutamyl-tRNA reductase [Desulfobacterales bacterium CG2_30_60_27]